MKGNNPKPTRIASVDTSSASDSDTSPAFVDSYLNSNLPHNTSITADHGHDYQKELFLYFCLIFNNWEECLWKIGFEVKDSVKFDDIVAEIEINGKKYSLLIQAKHSAHVDKIVTRDHILSNAVKKGNMEKNFEVKQYYDAAIKDKRSSDRIWKFCVLTNYKIDLGDPSGDLQTTEETDPIFENLFKELNDFCEKNIQTIKFEKEITLNDGLKITDPFFLNNFTYVSQLPNFQDLTTVNNSILEKTYKKFKSKNFSKVRNNVFNTLRVTKDAQGNLTRNPMTKNKFIKIIQNSVLEVDFPAFSADFCNQFNWLEFTDEALKAVDQNQKEHFCNGNAKLLSFMIYKALIANFSEKIDQKKIFCIPFSKLTQIYNRESLRVFDHKVVVYVEQKDPKEDYASYKNAIFVFQSSEEHLKSEICTFESLKDKSKDHFLNQKIKLQGYLVEIAKITKDSALLTEILQEMFRDKQPLELGIELHNHEQVLPKYYMDRLFTNNTTMEENMKEEEIYEEGQNIIIQGLAGVGKSTAMLKVAKIIKKNNPQFFVQLIDLKTHSDNLKKIKEKGVRITDDHQGNTIDLWMFVKANFLGIKAKEKSQTVEELLLEDYLKEATPKIVLFLDGFDEISPLYSEQVIQIIEGLKVKNIQMFLSSQSHLKETINKLGFHKKYTLEPYNRPMQRGFLRQYWGNHLHTMIKNNEIAESTVEKQNVHAYTKKFFKMCYRSKLTDLTPSIPLMLNILADTYLDECMEFCKKTSKNWSENILEVDVLMIYEKIFKDNCKNFYRKTEVKASNVYISMKEQDIIEEVRRTHMEIAAKHLLRGFWTEEGSLDVEKMKYEIYGRGFITGNKVGEYIFIYKTFMYFFAADWFTRKIFPDDKFLDINLLKCLLKKEDDKKDKTLDDRDIDRGVTSFIYRFMLKKLKEVKEKLNLEQHKGEANQVSDFILSFFHYAWFNREISQLEIVFDMAKTFCPNEKVKEICKNKKLLETLPFTSPGQLKLTVDIYDYYFGPEVTNAIMKNRNMNKILNQIIKEANFQLFKDYFDLLTTRSVVTDQENLPKLTYENFRNYLKKQKVSSWMFAREILLWHYEHLNTSQEEILSLMEEIIGEEEFKERHFLGHSLASFWDWRENDKAFLETICNQAELKRNYYRFLYALNSVTREDILEKSIEVMRENGCRFICHDGKSVLCHAFEDNNNYLVERLLKILTEKEVEAQIKDEVCGGKSIIRQCTTENLLCVIFIRYILDNFGKDHKDIIQMFFSPMDEGKELSALESNIKFLNTMIKKDIKLEEGKLQECMKNFWSEAINKDVNLLHVIAREGKLVDIVQHVFNYMKACPDNLLVRHLERVDEKGNTPCHIAVQGTSTIFLDEIEKNIPKEEISRLFSIKNCEGKDVFDIIYENKKYPRSGEDYFTTYGVASFLENKDN